MIKRVFGHRFYELKFDLNIQKCSFCSLDDILESRRSNFPIQLCFINIREYISSHILIIIELGIFCSRGARSVIVIVVGNGHGNTGSILDETDYNSHSTNTLRKGMNPIIFPPAMG